MCEGNRTTMAPDDSITRVLVHSGMNLFAATIVTPVAQSTDGQERCGQEARADGDPIGNG